METSRKQFTDNGEKLYGELFQGNVPAALAYDGAPVDLNAQAWRRRTVNAAAYQLERRICFLDECLRVTLNIRRFYDGAAIEWFLELENTSEYDTKILSQIDIASIHFSFEPALTPFFYDANGSAEQICDFMIHKTQMFHWAHRRLKPVDGRSSSYTMPYFNLSVDRYGYILAVGWSGQWQARARRPGDAGIIEFTAGMEDGHFRLHGGERVTLPRMLILRWEGTEQDGYNEYRRFAFNNIVPKINGKPIQSPICLSSWGGMPAEGHKKNFETIRKHRLNGEAYWIDAGWYGEAPANNSEADGAWYQNAGINDWQPVPSLYPNGMEEVAYGAKELGLGFLLWYENERCRASSKRPKDHPDWYLGVREEGGDLLLDLGNPNARRWMTGLLKEHIRQLDMKVLRVDFNFGPLRFWRYGDAEDRKGIRELKYMDGFYRLWDDLLAAFPELIIDNCASGGRRLDYEALRRSIPLFRTDYACFGPRAEAIGFQLHTYYLNNFVPVNATSVNYSDMDTYLFRSAFSSGITMGVPAPDTPEKVFDWYRRMLDQAYRMREYMAGDFWPLTGCSYSEKDWMAYQMDLPGESRGMVIAYRRAESMIPAIDFELNGIDADAEYRVEDMDTGAYARISGRTLCDGWHFEIPAKRACRVVFYEKVQSS